MRRAMQQYLHEQGEVECERCATQNVKLRFVSPHKEKAFSEIEAEGFNVDFDPNQTHAVFYEETQKALIKKILALGDAACLCGSCGRFWTKLHKPKH